MPDISSLSFVAVDFETANSRRASVCQMGLTIVEGGSIVHEVGRLVVPPTGLDGFDARNVSIHGITPERAAQGVPWAAALDELLTVARGLPLVAYGNFDKGVYTQANELIGHHDVDRQWYDAAAAARRLLTLDNYRLPTVADHLGVPVLNHHDAQADARAAALVTLALAQTGGATRIGELWPSRARSNRGIPSSTSTPAKPFLPQPDPDAAPGHPLFGAHVVITGDLGTLTRMEAFELIASSGGTPQNNVTLQTTHLVVAEHERIGAAYHPSSGRSKERKADEYARRGQHIVFLGRRDLEDLLDASPVAAGIELLAPPAPVANTPLRVPEQVPAPAPLPPVPAPLPPTNAPATPAPAPRAAQQPWESRATQQPAPAAPPRQARAPRAGAVLKSVIGWTLLVAGAVLFLPVAVQLFAENQPASAVFGLAIAGGMIYGGFRLIRSSRRQG